MFDCRSQLKIYDLEFICFAQDNFPELPTVSYMYLK